MSSAPAMGAQDLAAHYEQLRQDALSLSQGGVSTPGLALLRRQGMTAWMRAWWATSVQKSEVGTLADSNTTQDFALDLRVQMTTLLAEMILG